ncbi:MAG: hypothetical protein ACT4PL_11820 [Phycisphaerales bacterium]
MAQLHSGDIVIRQNSGRLETGTVEPSTGLAVYPQRVFAAVLSATGFTNNPGFDSLPGAFPPSAQVGFDIEDTLRLWDGLNFDQISPSRLRIRFGGSEALTPIEPAVVPGFSTVPQSSGEFHRHFGFTLLAPSSPGVYLFTLRLWTDLPAVQPSEPFALVFSRGADPAEFAAALEFAESLFRAPSSCRIDFNNDGIVEPGDLDEFITAYFSLDPSEREDCDFNADGFVEPGDLDEFITAYFSGC